jgi:hypothetical protein
MIDATTPSASSEDTLMAVTLMLVMFGIFVVLPICVCIICKSRSPLATELAQWMADRFSVRCSHCGNRRRVDAFCARCGALQNKAETESKHPSQVLRSRSKSAG